MSYATNIAISRAHAVGLRLSLGDWREIFLAITDQMTGETRSSTVTASFVGKVRDGAERWHVKMPTHEFDVVYDPHQAVICLVIRPRDPDAQPAVSPKPTPPLKGKITERILLDA